MGGIDQLYVRAGWIMNVGPGSFVYYKMVVYVYTFKHCAPGQWRTILNDRVTLHAIMGHKDIDVHLLRNIYCIKIPHPYYTQC
eukprot:9750462-Karenia_brevis.AAC.1